MCVCACVRACVRACARARACVRACVRVCVCVVQQYVQVHLHTDRYTVTTRMIIVICIKMGSGESQYNPSLTVKGNVTRQCPPITIFKEEAREPV